MTKTASNFFKIIFMCQFDWKFRIIVTIHLYQQCSTGAREGWGSIVWQLSHTYSIHIGDRNRLLINPVFKVIRKILNKTAWALANFSVFYLSFHETLSYLTATYANSTSCQAHMRTQLDMSEFEEVEENNNTWTQP